ncbi:MAG: tripartite tricarboxylate transporter substrate binding protein [Burkholderiales bacterium]
MGRLPVCAALLIAVPLAVHAQTFPSKPVRLVVPFPAGGAMDSIARIMVQPLSRSFGQNVIVDNRPGGGTVIATEMVARSPADGHTLLLMANSFTINPAVRSKLPYDALKDFAGVSRLATVPVVFSVHPSVPARTFKELIALARARPGELTYATPGGGTNQHLIGEMLKSVARIDINHVPYQGGAPATMAVMGGHTSILIINVTESGPHILAGKLRALAVTSLQRSGDFNDVPTVAESGFPGFEAITWFGAVAPAATPRDAINRLNAEIVRALQLPEVRNGLGKLGLSAAGTSAEEFDAFIRSELRRNEKVARESNLKID